MIQLSGAVFDASEGTVVNIRVSRSGGVDGMVSVGYVLTAGTAAVTQDYPNMQGTLSWAHGIGGNLTISIPLTDDAIPEFSESFTVALVNVSRAMLGTPAMATVNIIDNDTSAHTAFGAISQLASATVNGIRYDTSATNVMVNGSSAGVSDLKVGHVVEVRGEANLSLATGTADEIGYSAAVIGPIESIDAALRRLIIAGQTIAVDAATQFDPGIDPDSFSGLTVGENAQASGFLNAAGEIVATRIDPDASATNVQVIGTITGLDQVNSLFSLNRLLVDYGSAAVVDLPGGSPADEQLVLVRGSLVGGVLQVNEIESAGVASVAPGETVLLGGLITRFASASDFDLGGVPVTGNAGTTFVGGLAEDLGPDVEIAVRGEVGTGGGTVAAREVLLGEPVAAGTIRTFDFQDFRNVSVDGLANITIVQGPEFSITVSIDSDIADDLQVQQSGNTVSFGFVSGTTARIFNAIIRMPQLDHLAVAATALANVTLRDFDQPQMAIDVNGVSRVGGERLAIGELTATVSGVSMLGLGNIAPIGTASIDISGVSQATLNMGVASTLTGSVTTGQGTGVSTLFYYGTSVSLNVTTDSVSQVRQLGATRL